MNCWRDSCLLLLSSSHIRSTLESLFLAPDLIWLILNQCKCIYNKLSESEKKCSECLCPLSLNFLLAERQLTKLCFVISSCFGPWIKIWYRCSRTVFKRPCLTVTELCVFKGSIILYHTAIHRHISTWRMTFCYPTIYWKLMQGSEGWYLRAAKTLKATPLKQTKNVESSGRDGLFCFWFRCNTSSAVLSQLSKCCSAARECEAPTAHAGSTGRREALPTYIFIGWASSASH